MLYVFVNSDKKKVFYATYDHNKAIDFISLHPNFNYNYTYFSEVTIYEETEEYCRQWYKGY